MTISRLKLNRFLVIHEQQAIYDETFHEGINVIRGEHSVGKSTLFDLIYYVLGGDLKKEEWRYPTNECTEVRAEIEINKKTITLAREILAGKKPKIRMFDGCYGKALKNYGNWLNFGSVRSDNKASFSEMMFDLFGWGQHKTESFNNLTMHQILRLSYLSQSSKTTSIFREEIDKRGDSGSTRKAIAEFLLGLDDLTSYDKRQTKGKKQIELAIFEANRDSIKKILGDDSATTFKDIETLINSKKYIIFDLIEEKNNKLSHTDSNSNHAIVLKREEIITTISYYTKLISLSFNKIELIQREISDCDLFSKSLEFRIKSLDESEKTYKSLGNISFNYCPSCFSQLDTVVAHNQCKLCKKILPDYDLTEKYTETLAELKYQQKQNTNTINKLQVELQNNENEYIKNNEKVMLLQNELSNISTHSNERELIISNYTKRISNVESGIIELNKKIPLIRNLEKYNRSISIITKEISKLVEEIDSLSELSKIRNRSVLNSLGETASGFLENGTGNEEDFKIATQKTVEIDFEKDRWLLGGRISFSESSNAEKKSALHISFLLQSLKDKQTRYPLFSIMDFECADLNEERSKKIQNNILNLLKDKEGFQLLITSSKISQELNIEEYGVGRYYGKNDYLFKI
ncbi:hypothetical protein [Desulfotalea psychrophila]|uniref:Rad50/SbcC-type AAA domain-containing protein n=1 Tax=Desulfotalea psychrophila (strain LSv54 / DSM 12343) TaxID=177439 RepID=Q6AKU0_DESPS|nr:hypothetical protein [Desulfotalea psychrophila]CAG37035.1 unknown protein [Desulfotalea psychrophila LSv54]